MKALRLAVVVLLCAGVGLLAQGRDPLAGAWESTAAKNLTTGAALPALTPPLHLIYSNGQYVQFAARAGRPKTTTPPAELTKEQLQETFRGVQGQYGTYRIEGNKLIRHIVSAVNVNNEGRDVTTEFKIEGDTLIVTGAGAPPNSGQMIEQRFRKLPAGK
jgi:hypothetical protein